ncbi:cell division protein FtsQ/DivIB [Tepidibacillus infernus]|uniref:cell division protein FtsQ/DivIB n=1 Tax=Tepidibacillus infernus TaxID=1806172 RepID=UPI003B6B2194
MYQSYQTIPQFKKQVMIPKKNRKLLRYLFLFFLLIAMITYFNLPISRITSIQITGLNLLTEKEIYEKGKLHQNMHYWFLKASSLENRLLELPEIKKVEVEKKYPGKLRIQILEQKPIAFLYSKKQWVPVLENGYLVQKKIDQIVMNRPLISEWKNNDQLPTLARELAKVDPAILDELSEIKNEPNMIDTNQVLIYTREGYRLHVHLDELSKKINLLSSILENLKAKTKNLGDIYLLDSIRFEEYKNSGEPNNEN